ncbi:MAG: M14 family metallopeptidase [Thermomicrobiales bacterium]
MPTISPWVATSPDYRPDRYYRYQDLTDLLRKWSEDYQHLVTMASIGKSYEGRDIWALTITNAETGPDTEKPAYFVDANIHAGEVTGCATTLKLIHLLLTGYGSDEAITRLLDTAAFYIVPAIMVDGMDRYLSTPDRMRSSMRPYPKAEQKDGIIRSDLDGNGISATMRVKDPNGPWKPAADDPRVMVKRGPDEFGGDYYFVLPEGLIADWDGGAIKVASDLWGLDLNRNFPYDWAPEWKQKGAGEIPLSDPETRALIEFIVKHPNICGSQHFHTWSAVILRTSAILPDSDMNKFDLETYKTIGKMGEEETGYPCVSIHDGFAYDKKQPINGSLLDWMYTTLGAYTYATELWSLPRKAGVEVTDFIAWGQDHPEADDVAMVRALDELVPEHGFLPWTPFEHPQLGSVEIGGFDFKFHLQNPPGPLLDEVSEGNARFVLRAAQTLPRISFSSTGAESLGGDIYRVSALVQNAGFLPTYLTEVGRATGQIEPPTVTITVPEGAEVVSGKVEQKLDHLDGRANQYGAMPSTPVYGNRSRAKAEWIIRAPGGGLVELLVTSTKAGADRAMIELSGEAA